jgi:hypothetical protein
MARTLLVNDILRVSVICGGGTLATSQLAVNLYSYNIQATSFTSGPTDAQVAAALDNLAAPLYKLLIGNLTTYRGILLSYWNVTPLPVTQESNLNTGAGTGGATLLATQVRGIIKRLTNFAGRKYRGRLFLPFPTSTFSNTNGTPSGAYLTATANLVTALEPAAGITVAGGGGTVTLLPIIWHRVSRTYDYITGHETEAYFATQRKSGNFGRPNLIPF